MTKGGNPQLVLVHYSRGQAVRKSLPSSTLATLRTVTQPTTRAPTAIRPNNSCEPRLQPTNPLVPPTTCQPPRGLRRWRENRTEGDARSSWRTLGRERSRRCTWRDSSGYARQHPRRHPRWYARRHARRYGRRNAWWTRWARTPTASTESRPGTRPYARCSQSTASTSSRPSTTSTTWTTGCAPADWNGISRPSDDPIYVSATEPTVRSSRTAECPRERTEGER
jgi:hypothetical protein